MDKIPFQISSSDLKNVFFELKEYILTSEFRNIVAKKQLNNEKNFTNSILAGLEFSLGALDAFSEDQELILDINAVDELENKEALDDKSYSNVYPQSDDLNSNTDLSEQKSASLNLVENEQTAKSNVNFSNISTIIAEIPNLVNQINDSLPNHKEDFKKWGNDLSKLNETSAKNMLNLVDNNSIAKKNFESLYLKLNFLKDGSLKAEDLHKFEEGFNILVQNFADFDHLQQYFVDNFSKYNASSDFIFGYFFEMYRILNSINDELISLKISAISATN